MLTLVGGVARLRDTTINVEDEGAGAFEASILNFTGAGVAAQNAGGGQANISISGAAVASSIYDESTTIGSGGLTAGNPISLPNGGEYQDDDLEVFVGGIFMQPGVDYNYVGAGPLRTQITFVEDLAEGERVRFRVEEAAFTIYDETIVVGAGGIGTGVNITLPNSGTYIGDDLEVYLNGDFMDMDIDWNQVGSVPRTDIQMTFDLVEGDRLRFRIDHV